MNLDPSAFHVDNWPTALVLIFVFGIPTIMLAWNNRATKRVAAALENNGGSSVKDAIDRIETTVISLDQRLARVEQEQAHAKQKRGVRRLLS